ncbi:MAG: beta-lactamase family protein [Deltaproteobacteria bacterium]|nr:MAG: beta-lactamase family protein [Deltaproteobacteria bacterium]
MHARPRVRGVARRLFFGPQAGCGPAGEVMTGDTPSADLDGNTFIVPDGWKVETFAAMVVISPPEGDSHLAVIDVSADSNDAARDAGWKVYKPDVTWPLLATVDTPDRDGWTRGKSYNYRTSPNEKRGVGASTRFANGRWCVVIFDFADATAEKRAGQLAKVFSHFYPKGYSRESFGGKTAAKIDAGKLEQLKKFVRDAEEATGVPGVSFGVIQDGKLVWAGGIGVRELGKSETVDDKTLFMIASNTKSLTTLMLAKLVDARRIAWDQPVTSILPSFKLGSAEITKQVLVKHLICACTGLPRQDLEWLMEWKGSTPESVMKTLGTMMPTSKFGELFQYSNLMAAAGGYTGGHALYPKLELGAAYDKAMQTLVFDPLGMKATTFDYAKALRGNHAMPHGINVDGKPARDAMDENYSAISARPAGAAWSNVDDLLKYLAMELAEGKLPGGKPYISKDALFARRAPGVAIGADAAYGMGLFIQTKYDITVYHHGGDLIGFHSDMMWIPEANVGAVVLTNGDLGPIIRGQFQRKLLEVLYDGKPEADENVAQAAKNFFTQHTAVRKLLTVPPEPAAVAKLARGYRNAALGEIKVVARDGKTVFDFGEFRSEVATLKNPDGTVTFQTIDPGIAGFEFVVGEAAGKPTLTLRDGQHEYVFDAQ